jgi:dihydrofolate reductase
MIAAIVAVDNNWGIGYNGELLERIPEDMKHFRELTENNIVIMGRKTWDSLPIKPLQGRSNIILSRTLQKDSWIYDDKAHYIQFVSKITKHDLKTFQNSSNHLFVIGGGSIYEQLLPYCDTVYLTHIGKDHANVDTYFPRIDKDPNWEIDTCTELRESVTGIPYAFITYKRV